MKFRPDEITSFIKLQSKVIKVGVLKGWIMISFCQEMAFVAALSQVKDCYKILKTYYFAYVYQLIQQWLLCQQ